MSFGKDLSHEFQKLTKNGEYQEVELITKLQDAFINLANGKYYYAIDIIHGSRSFVDFQYNAPWLQNVSSGETFTRELSDMMFLVFSKKHKHIRLMYMQNKKGDSSTKFKADLLQLCLLKNRCVISSPNLPGCIFGDSRILTDALLPSVGSYGVFYNINEVTEMAYYPACNVITRSHCLPMAIFCGLRRMHPGARLWNTARKSTERENRKVTKYASRA